MAFDGLGLPRNFCDLVCFSVDLTLGKSPRYILSTLSNFLWISSKKLFGCSVGYYGFDPYKSLGLPALQKGLILKHHILFGGLLNNS